MITIIKTLNAKDIYLLGSEITGSEVFKSPTSSIDVGITAAENFSCNEKIISAEEIKCKCILLRLCNKQYIISLLHE